MPLPAFARERPLKTSRRRLSTGRWRRSTATPTAGAPALAWLYGIARNVVKETRRTTCANRRTESWKTRSIAMTATVPPAALLPLQADGTEGLASRMDLDHAMGCLTDTQREVVRLRYFAGLSATETGQVIGRPETAVYALQARALAALRRHLA